MKGSWDALGESEVGDKSPFPVTGDDECSTPCVTVRTIQMILLGIGRVKQAPKTYTDRKGSEGLANQPYAELRRFSAIHLYGCSFAAELQSLLAERQAGRRVSAKHI